MRKQEQSQLGDEIVKSITEEPARWFQGGCCLIRDDGVEIWTRNGADHIHLWAPQRMEFPKKVRKQIARAISNRHQHVTLDDLKNWERLPIEDDASEAAE